MKTFVSLLILAVILVLCWFGWQKYHTAQVLDSGSVHCEGCMTGERKAAFLRENSGEGPDGQSEHKWDFSRGADGQKREYSEADDPNYRAPYSEDQRTAPPETRASGEPYDRVYTGGCLLAGMQARHRFGIPWPRMLRMGSDLVGVGLSSGIGKGISPGGSIP